MTHEEEAAAPDWVQQAAAAGELPMAETPAAEPPAPATAEPPAPLTPPAGELPSLDDDATFAWLESLALKQGATEAILMAHEEEAEAPDWVQQAAAAGEPPAQPAPLVFYEEEELLAEDAFDEAAAEPETPQAGPGVMLDDDATFAWLESLAVKQGATEALLLTPEERHEELPDWVVQPEPPPLPPAPKPGEARKQGGTSGLSMPAGLAAALAAEEAAHREQERPIPAPAPVAKAPPAVPIATPPVANLPPAAPGEVPDLPSWLSGPAAEQREELEWTPPPIPIRRYDLNKASLAELERLPGIGFIMAQQIVSYRNRNGPFRFLDELLNVPDFTQAMLEPLQDRLYIEAIEQPRRPGTGPLRPLVDMVTLPAMDEGLPPDLIQARRQLTSGNLENSLAGYTELVRSGQHLNQVIEDLTQAAGEYPDTVEVWQLLGDAQMRNNQVSEAMQAYIKAEQLMR